MKFELMLGVLLPVIGALKCHNSNFSQKPSLLFSYFWQMQVDCRNNSIGAFSSISCFCAGMHFDPLKWGNYVV